MDKKSIAREWFDIAETDLSSAEFLQNMRPVPIEIICYHCQQCAEKYLKGYLSFNGGKISKSHDLPLLNKLCLQYDKDFKEINEDCLYLTDCSVVVRYPFNLDLEESDMIIAIKHAQKVKSLVLNKTS